MMEGLAPAAFLAWQISATHFTSVLSSLSCCVKPQPAQVGTEPWGPATRDLRREYRMCFSNIHSDTGQHKDLTQRSTATREAPSGEPCTARMYVEGSKTRCSSRTSLPVSLRPCRWQDKDVQPSLSLDQKKPSWDGPPLFDRSATRATPSPDGTASFTGI